MDAAPSHSSDADSKTSRQHVSDHSLATEARIQIAGVNSWAHHCDPEIKDHSVEYRYQLLPEIIKIHPQTSDGKCMLTVFCDS
jgi:hypothetical protein